LRIGGVRGAARPPSKIHSRGQEAPQRFLTTEEEEISWRPFDSPNLLTVMPIAAKRTLAYNYKGLAFFSLE